MTVLLKGLIKVWEDGDTEPKTLVLLEEEAASLQPPPLPDERAR